MQIIIIFAPGVAVICAPLNYIVREITMKLLDEYFKVQNEIYDYFGYKEDWVVIPLDDARTYFWWVDDNEVHFADTEKELFDEDGNYYVNEIYTQIFLPKWVYRSEDFTMICVDTRTDGNRFLQVFDNSKECKAP